MIMLDPRLVAAVEMTGGTVECISMTEHHGGKREARKLLLRLRKNGVEVEMRLAPAVTADFAEQLQEVIDWLGEAR